MGYYQAGFYDGSSSRKHNARVFIDELNHRLDIGHEELVNEYWPFHDMVVSHTGDHTEIKNKKMPGKLLHVQDAEFRKEIRRVLDSRNHTGWYQRMLYAGTAFHATLAVSLLAIIAAIYLWVLPFVAEKAVEILPETYDESLGSNFMETFVQYESVDSAKTQLVRQFAAEIDFNTDRNLVFTVIRSEEKNAFALPDGNIIIHAGIIKQMNSYDELAALMGHESAHVSNRHSMKLLCRNLAGYLFLSVVLSDINGVMAIIADNAHQLQSLSYSRNFEKEADMDGMEIMINNNIDPHGMLDLFEILKKDHSSGLPGFISTHPLTDDRIEYIKDRINSASYNPESRQKLEEIFRLL